MSDDDKAIRETILALLDSPPEEIPDLLEDSGWAEVVADDEATAIRALFGEHGRAAGHSAILDGVILTRLGVSADAVGYSVVERDGEVSGILLQDPKPDAVIVIPSADGIATFPAAAARLDALSSFDPSSRWIGFTVLAGQLTTLAGGDWSAAEAAGRRAVAAEHLGSAGEMLRLATEYTSTRQQYGHPIATFQSVRHRYADSFAAIRGADGALTAAFADAGPLSAMVAKAAAMRAATLTAGHAIQTFGAIGSTLEHSLHRYVARAAALDVLLSTRAELLAIVGGMILEDGDAPILTEI